MSRRLQSPFLHSAAVILFLTGMAKLFSVLGTAAALEEPDALLGLSHRHIFILLGGLELALSAFLLMGRSPQVKLALVAWLATNFLVYRLGLWSMGAPNLCNCLGNLNDYLPVSPRTLNAAAFAALGWLLAGSYTFLIAAWRNRPVEVCPEPLPEGSGTMTNRHGN
jgi:hypothetical protein